MVKILRVDDDVHEIISQMAQKEDRKLTPFLNRLFRELKEGRMNQGIVGLPDENTPLPKNTVRQNPEHPEDFGIVPITYAPEKKSEATPPTSSVADLFTAPPYDPAVAEKQLSGELPCCMNENKPCKHWVWDVQSGEGYRNSLSGRLMEVE